MRCRVVLSKLLALPAQPKERLLLERLDKSNRPPVTSDPLMIFFCRMGNAREVAVIAQIG